METPIIVTSMYDLRNIIRSRKILKANEVFNVLTMNLTVVPRNGIEEDYYVKENVLDNFTDKLPTISDALRVDIFNYYNNMFTNKLNRKMVNTISEIRIVNKHIKQYKVFIGNYYTDKEEVIKESLVSEGFRYAIDNLNLYYSINDETIVDNLTTTVNYYTKLNKIDTEKILPLIFLDKFKVLPTEVYIPKNNRLESGETLLLEDLSVLSVDNLSVECETIVVDKNSDKLYLLDRTHDRKISIRVLLSDEIFTDRKFKY